MEAVFIQVKRLAEVLLLHLVPDATLLALVACTSQLTEAETVQGGRTGFGEEELVDDDVVRVDLVLRQFLDEPFRLVQREELGDADADECCLFLIRVSSGVDESAIREGSD